MLFYFIFSNSVNPRKPPGPREMCSRTGERSEATSTSWSSVRHSIEAWSSRYDSAHYLSCENIKLFKHNTCWLNLKQRRLENTETRKSLLNLCRFFLSFIWLLTNFLHSWKYCVKPQISHKISKKSCMLLGELSLVLL